MEVSVKRKILCPCQDSNPGPATPSLVAMLILSTTVTDFSQHVNPLNAKLNPICHLLALLGGSTIVVVSRLRVNEDLSLLACYTKRDVTKALNLR